MAFPLTYKKVHNTVIISKNVTVYYPLHPYYGRSLPILNIHNSKDSPGYLCKIKDKVTLFIPKWVTYPEAEKCYTLQKKPQISFDTLLKLGDLLDTIVRS